MEEFGVEVRRTDDGRFDGLPEYPFKPHYAEVPDGEGGQLRMHYVAEGPADGEVVLCLHGQPSWSYLYRKMIPGLVGAGYRVIAPDLVGFGRSDKPARREDYTYERHVGWLRSLLEALDLTDITMFCQDWGGLIGLRVAAENPDRFARIVAANTGLPDAQGVADADRGPVSDSMRAHYETLPVPANAVEMALNMGGDDSGMGFLHWVKFCAESDGFVIGDVLNTSCGGALSEDEVRAYNAPFPDEAYKAGARQFPSLVPIMPDNPAIEANRAAWRVFEQWEKPFLTAFSDSDPVTAGGFRRFQETVPGARGQAHVTIEGAGHFLQEQAPEQLVATIDAFIRANPLS
jgi:haloalkane dehalogenase